MPGTRPSCGSSKAPTAPCLFVLVYFRHCKQQSIFDCVTCNTLTTLLIRLGSRPAPAPALRRQLPPDGPLPDGPMGGTGSLPWPHYSWGSATTPAPGGQRPHYSWGSAGHQGSRHATTGLPPATTGLPPPRAFLAFRSFLRPATTGLPPATGLPPPRAFLRRSSRGHAPWCTCRVDMGTAHSAHTTAGSHRESALHLSLPLEY
jgi:hypothetical protein